MIMPSFYCGPVTYYAELVKHRRVVFERYEHFVKQTPRNRCTVDSPNGPVTLTIPINKTGDKMKMKDVKISFEENKLSEHWHALKSAYGTSPYFHYYDYLFYPLYENPPELLIDFNTALHKVIMKCLDFDTEYGFTDSFLPIESDFDPRVQFNEKQHRFTGDLPEYRQVFARKNGFLKNLSVLDLIFNLGPEAGTYIISNDIEIN